jgi:hypothetical protein
MFTARGPFRVRDGGFRVCHPRPVNPLIADLPARDAFFSLGPKAAIADTARAVGLGPVSISNLLLSHASLTAYVAVYRFEEPGQNASKGVHCWARGGGGLADRDAGTAIGDQKSPSLSLTRLNGGRFILERE